MSKKKWAVIAAGAAVTALYGFATGKGVFNSVRFKDEREAVRGYIASRRENASFSNLKASGNGWMTVLTEDSGEQYILYLYKYENSYIFSEHKLGDV